MVFSFSFLQPTGEFKIIKYGVESHEVQNGRDPQSAAPVITPITIRGISIGTARALLRAGMPHLAMAVEILTDKGYATKVISRSELTHILAGFLSKEQARKAFDEFSGKPSSRYSKKGVYKQGVAKKIETFREFLVKMSSINILKHLNLDNLTTNSPVSKRGRVGEGRPSKAVVYIPSEAELKTLLKGAGFICGDVTIRRDAKLQGEFATWPVKPLDAFEKSSSYKDFIMGYQVYQHGEGKYSRKQLTDPIGDQPRNARRRAQRLGFTVTPNDPKLRPLKQADVERLIPKDEEARLQWIANGWCTENDYIKNSRVDRKRYRYTWEGYRQARETSKTGKVYRARDEMSTYDPSTSKWYGG
jgi:hypothetical protein